MKQYLLTIFALLCFIATQAQEDTTSFIWGVGKALLGDISATSFVAYYFIALIGMAFHMLINVGERDKDSIKSPVGFSWTFWFKDNGRRLAISLIGIFAMIIGCSQIMGSDINNLNAFLIGFTSDRAVEFFKNKKII